MTLREQILGITGLQKMNGWDGVSYTYQGKNADDFVGLIDRICAHDSKKRKDIPVYYKDSKLGNVRAFDIYWDKELDGIVVAGKEK